MERRFQIEWHGGGGYNWQVYTSGITASEVETHCRINQKAWEQGLYRLTELKPIAVSFKTIIDLQEIG